ncbi:hypothetical protein G6F37_010805 [Rhizopus arrhizus]|nr:hypothetical protein G6F38_010795 [Rhizopus arrhizus]KAG1152359.1 hypothetical protein G6F37_010805 [Rhizopus arrhizus]
MSVGQIRDGNAENDQNHSSSFDFVGISWFPVQLKDDVDYSSCSKDEEIICEDTSSTREEDEQIMQVDSQFVGEDGFDDTSDRRSSTSHQIPSKGFGQEPKTQSSELGKSLSTVRRKYRRTKMVGRVLSTEKWVAHCGIYTCNNEVFEVASKEDRNIIEIFANLVTKLPNFERLSPVGEIELTVNFLDPILSPIFHCPDNNKHLMWLNRKDESTAIFRPDAITVAIQQKADTDTLGYVEVKPPDFESNPELAFMDLVRLGTFSRRLMLRKNNRKVIVVQCIGYHLVFYLVSTFTEEITQLAGILSIDVPKEIGQIGCLLQKVDDFKRLFLLYEHQIETWYRISRALEEEDAAPPIDAINPKRRKQKIPSFSLV